MWGDEPSGEEPLMRWWEVGITIALVIALVANWVMLATI
jgi:hypothetical protein